MSLALTHISLLVEDVQKALIFYSEATLSACTEVWEKLKQLVALKSERE